MVPSELIGEGSIGGLLVFLGCWSKGPYSVPDQQGDSHCTADCWVQEKNKEHRPRNWKDTREEANNDLTAIKAALGDDTLRRTADTLPLAPGNWQNNIVEEEGKADSD
jgi:hypothetical protein